MPKAAADLWKRLTNRHSVRNWYHARAMRLVGAGRLDLAQTREALKEKLRAMAAQPGRIITAARVGEFLGPVHGGSAWIFFGPVGHDIRASFVGNDVIAHIIRANDHELKEIVLVRTELVRGGASGAFGGRTEGDYANQVRKVPVPLRRYLWAGDDWSIDASPWH